MRITIPTEKAVLITKLFLSSIAALISFAFSVIATNPIFSSSLKTFLIVVNLKLLYELNDFLDGFGINEDYGTFG